MCFFLLSPTYNGFFLCCFFSLAASIPHASRDHISDGVVIFPPPFFSFFDLFSSHTVLKGARLHGFGQDGVGGLGWGREPRSGITGGFFRGNTGEDGAVDRYGHVHWMTLQNGILSRRNCKTLRAELLQLLSELPTKPPSLVTSV